MKTSKAFSTISYNSPEFLAVKLEDLVKRRVISFFAFVKHHKEQDEGKDHIHVYIAPNGQYNTDALDDYLAELDKRHPDNPALGIMPCQSSKWDDWFLYCSHDKAYLASKGQTRKYHYTPDDFITSHEEYFQELIHTIDRTKYVKTQDFVDKVEAGVPFRDMVARGEIPVPQFNQWFSMYYFLREDTTSRDDRETHTPK